MANRQTIPGSEFSGGGLRKATRTSQVSVGTTRELGDNFVLDTMTSMLDLGREFLKLKQKNDYKNFDMEADQIIKGYRQKMENSFSPDEFDALSQAMESDLKTRFNDRLFGKSYWDNRGEGLLRANRKDVEQLRVQKNFEFGRNSLNDMLANTQNMLAYSGGDKGGMLLAQGLDEIENTPLLSLDEKAQYRADYLKTGLLNLALNDPDEALALTQKYIPDEKNSAPLKEKIEQTRKLNLEAEEINRKEEERQAALQGIGRSISFWQKAEQGNITPAQFFVLNDGNEKKDLWGLYEDRKQAPLREAYLTAKKLNGGEVIEAREICDAENYLIAAYRQKKIGFEQAVGLQEKILQVGLNGQGGTLFDEEAMGLADMLLGSDAVVANSSAATAFMEEKAKFAFGIYDAYAAKKEELMAGVVQAGGQLTPMVEKKLRRDAATAVAADYGYHVGTGEAVSYEELQHLMALYYGGADEASVWQKFAKVAPYAQDKKEALRRVAAAERMAELKLPQFQSMREVREAGLQKGQRFYLKGRLSVLS